MSTERDELAAALQDVIEGADNWDYDDMASALIMRGYSKPKKVKGETPEGLIKELFKQVKSWESQGHSTVGLAFLRRHFKVQP